jgi:phosphoglucomutase
LAGRGPARRRGRLSGTENIYKIYAESFKDQTHLQTIASEAQLIVNSALAG